MRIQGIEFTPDMLARLDEIWKLYIGIIAIRAQEKVLTERVGALKLDLDDLERRKFFGELQESIDRTEKTLNEISIKLDRDKPRQ